MSSGPLREYKKKRDFAVTPEPEGRVRENPSGRLYVIQKHAATRLHYDLRLELDGTLKSWAVPKGPSCDPSEKRLAVHVEDHPVEYGSFEGIIPRGEYGGGTVMLWDEGEWEPEGDPMRGYEKGHLSFRLHGRKLRGTWTLARMGGRASEEGKNWLLIKRRDEYARLLSEFDPVEKEPRSVISNRSIEEIAAAQGRVWSSDRPPEAQSGPRPKASPEPLDPIDPSALPNARRSEIPNELKPQAATLADRVPEQEGWIHEIKYDGYRVLCFVENGTARLITRNGKDWTDRFAEVAREAARLPLTWCVLDGEVVVVGPDGTTDFQALQNVLKGLAAGQLVYYIFDLPYCEGFDLTRAPLVERKNLLRRILSHPLEKGTVLRYSDHILGRGDQVYRNACRLALEGVVSKRIDSGYEQKRTSNWLKVKCLQRQEFVIGGFTEPSGSREGFGALLLGYHDNGGGLVFAGKVGTGFDGRSLRRILDVLKPLEQAEPPFSNPPTRSEARGVHWVLPEKVAEVEFTAWTSDGRPRHPSFKGLREDKPPREVRREEPVDLPTAAVGNGPMPPKPASRRRRAAVRDQPTRIAGVTLTNPDRVLYPEQGLTKSELALFYEQISDRILPHVAGRPLTLVRCPMGRERDCFYQKHLVESLQGHLRGIPVREENEERLYIAIDDLPGLIALVQMGALELHPWGSREDKLEQPDVVTFDLDPDPKVPWDEVVRGALLVRDTLAEYGFRSFAKTSGGKGLHVVLRLAPRSSWGEVKAFTEAVTRRIVQREPNAFLMTMSKAKRSGKVFIDYFRNTRGATSVAAYSTRARPGAPVSTPLGWEEIETNRPDSYSISNLRDRLAGLKKDPWEGYFDAPRAITRAVKKDLGL